MTSPSSQTPTSPRVDSAISEGVAMLELIDAISEVEPELAPPEQDDDQDYYFVAEMSKSFPDEELGDNVADQRKTNIKRQMEKLQNQEYVQKAKNDYEVIQDQLIAELGAADAKHSTITQLSTLTDHTVLVSPILCRVEELLVEVQDGLGWNDMSITTNRVLKQMNILEATKTGHVALMNLHSCGTQSSSALNPTFPKPVNGDVDSNAVECSSEHHAAFVRFNDSIESWRLKHTFGETINMGNLIAKKCHEELLPRAEITTINLPRVFFPPPEYRHLTPPDLARVNFHWSPDLLESAPSLEAAKKELDEDQATFSYYSRSIYHPTYSFSAQRSSSLPHLSEVFALERDLREVRHLANLSLDPANEWILGRTYIALCLATEDWSPQILAEIGWLYARIEGNDDVRSLSLEEVEAIGGPEIRQQVEKLSSLWRSSGRTSIGTMVGLSGLLEEAIAGWKLEEIRKMKLLPYPARAASLEAYPVLAGDSCGIFCTPAVTSDGRFPYSLSSTD